MSAKKTSYIDALGNRQTGYIIKGSTYADAAGTTPVEKGSIVSAGGKQWVKGVGENGGSMLYTDYIKKLEKGPLSPETDSGTELLRQQLEGVRKNFDETMAANEDSFKAGLVRSKSEEQRRADSLNAEYGDLNTQLYRDYMFALRDLPQLLSAKGINGGLSESSILGMEADYRGTLAANERARLSGIEDIRAQSEQNIRDLEAAKAKADTEARSSFDSRQWSILEAMNERAEKQRENSLSQARQSGEKLYSTLLEKAEILAKAGDFSGYRALGYSDSEIAAMEKAYEDKMFATWLKNAQSKARYGDGSAISALFGI